MIGVIAGLSARRAQSERRQSPSSYYWIESWVAPKQDERRIPEIQGRQDANVSESRGSGSDHPRRKMKGDRKGKIGGKVKKDGERDRVAKGRPWDWKKRS